MEGSEHNRHQGETPVIEDVNEKELEQCIAAKFHFVDLAGSERVGRTGNRGERFKGTCTGYGWDAPRFKIG